MYRRPMLALALAALFAGGLTAVAAIADPLTDTGTVTSAGGQALSDVQIGFGNESTSTARTGRSASTSRAMHRRSAG